MSREYFVTKFMSGQIQAPRRMKWWLDHSCVCQAYVACAMSSDKSVSSGAPVLRKRGMDYSVEWDSMSRMEHAMAEHVNLEFAMVEAALAKNFDRENMVTISEFMVENIEKLLAGARRILDFPSGFWRMLLMDHVRIFVDMVRWNVFMDSRKLSDCRERWNSNSLALSAFSAEWF